MPHRPKVVAFDIIGTVFSMEPMRAPLVGLGLPSLALDLLYTAGLRDTFALATTNSFAPFQAVLSACLDELLAMQGLTASSKDKQAVLDMMRALPPHGDAKAAFQVLVDSGVRVCALSNGAVKTTQGLLAAASMDGMVEQILSVEDVKLSKPRAEVYLYAAQTAGVAPGEMALIATHPWDLHGAKIAGLMAGYVARGRPYSAVLKGPDVTGETLLDVASEMARI
ncbi:HAD-IA family hydrolase [Methylobacterium sp. E-041]|uniref:HAD-IA family hydrolase n=1 Tax=unclassified Methylobacterium TaxID=2615210 RepID=UPI001FB913CB|nr:MULTISPECIES: HAD-IA family hydrolase [unclassified Methylobacterium]MCJ2038135.1 HAD-IA family hydrolase [Methylobacterium sp. J-059]MCJ2106751.1 HAD-IA family hydrolase [Methylobacterium sp. E-041]